MTQKTVIDRFRLDGKVALVTGGARGLGKTMATALAEAGATIALAGRSKAACQEAATAILSLLTGRMRRFLQLLSTFNTPIPPMLVASFCEDTCSEPNTNLDTACRLGLVKDENGTFVIRFSLIRQKLYRFVAGD